MTAHEHSPGSRTSPAGYRHPAYVASLAEFGTPCSLRRSGGRLLIREVDGSADRDAMGPYPLFCCSDWSQLAADLDELRDSVVSVVLVTDPFGEWTIEQLDTAFPDKRVAIKEHFVVKLAPAPLSRVSTHHRRNARHGLRKVDVDLVSDPPSVIDEWVAMYGQLVRRHGIEGLAAFSRASFARQLAVPGMSAFRATEGEAAVGAALWYVDGDVAYWHLAAYSERGYGVDASYALLASAMEHFEAAGVRWLALGAGAGIPADDADGLTRFKAGWATETRTVHLCGRILKPDRYEALSALRGAGAAGFFPAYRSIGGARMPHR